MAPFYNEKGMDPDAVLKHRNETGSIVNFPGAANLKKNTDGLEMECDILIPAALESVIHEDNAPSIKAKIIGEAANGPLDARCRCYPEQERRDRSAGHVPERRR